MLKYSYLYEVMRGYIVVNSIDYKSIKWKRGLDNLFFDFFYLR